MTDARLGAAFTTFRPSFQGERIQSARRLADADRQREPALQILLNVLSQAAVLGPLAVGIALVYRISHVANFAAGIIAIVAGQVAATLAPGPVGILVALVAGAFLGLGTYLVAVLPGQLLKGPAIAMTMATLGLGLALEALSDLFLGAKTSAMDPLLSGSTTILGTDVSHQRILAICVGVLVVILTIVLFDRSLVGRAMEACAGHEELVAAYGINARVFHMTAWTVGGLCAGVTGVLQVGLASVSSTLSIQLLTLALIGSVLGGIGALRATALGVLVVAAVGSLSKGYISSTFVLTPIFLLLLVGLAVRPAGLFTTARSGDRG